MAVDIGQVIGGIAGRHLLRMHAEDRVVEAGQPPGMFKVLQE